MEKLKAQALLELAIFGALIIMLLGVLINYGLRYNYQQQVTQEAFRKALTSAAASTLADTPTSTTNVVVRDKHIPDPSNPFGIGSVIPVSSSASVTRSHKMLDTAVDYPSLPEVKIEVNGTSPFSQQSFKTAGIRVEKDILGYDKDGRNVQDSIDSLDKYEDIYGALNISLRPNTLKTPSFVLTITGTGEFTYIPPLSNSAGELISPGSIAGTKLNADVNVYPNVILRFNSIHEADFSLGNATVMSGTFPNGVFSGTGNFSKGFNFGGATTITFSGTTGNNSTTGAPIYAFTASVPYLGGNSCPPESWSLPPGANQVCSGDINIIDSCAGEIVDYNSAKKQCRQIADKAFCTDECNLSNPPGSETDCGKICNQNMNTPWYCEAGVLDQLFPAKDAVPMGLQPDYIKTTTITNNKLERSETSGSIITTDTIDWQDKTERKIIFRPYDPEGTGFKLGAPDYTRKEEWADIIYRPTLKNKRWETPW